MKNRKIRTVDPRPKLAKPPSTDWAHATAHSWVGLDEPGEIPPTQVTGEVLVDASNKHMRMQA